MYDFIYKNDFVCKNVYEMGMGEKTERECKKIPVWLPSHPLVYDMEADYFPVSENTENKPDLPIWFWP